MKPSAFALTNPGKCGRIARPNARLPPPEWLIHNRHADRGTGRTPYGQPAFKIVSRTGLAMSVAAGSRGRIARSRKARKLYI
jgi:hypothetical protein